MKPTRVKMCRAWVETWPNGLLFDCNRACATVWKFSGRKSSAIVVLDARDHAAREAKIKRLRKELKWYRDGRPYRLATKQEDDAKGAEKLCRDLRKMADELRDGKPIKPAAKRLSDRNILPGRAVYTKKPATKRRRMSSPCVIVNAKTGKEHKSFLNKWTNVIRSTKINRRKPR